ncbi:DUF1684 domain-containing protein [Nocardioides sp. Kera G14]|uniref:DUF1684 domain-containing protein n=1 Tax=Nocardioides sp. Kera G14 TaxID=2884264 RepID=UPI001D10973E|nr:DUF1684 domain-containing protein [Nocardioides sp. Kera G14]UDY24390.1 DUF1684 domain-containing protein [Nocardioides sp. Kera G14]
MTLTRDPDTYTSEWQAWHQAHEAARADGHGFLAVTGLHWLTERPQSLDDAPGEWWSDADGVHVTLDAAEGVTLDGVTLEGTHDFGPIPERGGVTLLRGDVAIEVARRGGHDIVRPRDPQNPLRVQYAGTPTYFPAPEWVLEGRYVAFDAPRPTTVGSVADGLEHVYDAPGQVTFEINGTPQALTAFPGGAEGALLVLFTDATSGVTTYPANRSLAVAPPDDEGRVILDFNHAVNLPCAYTDHATCPLPPEENRLSFAVEAGEKLPVERGGHR